MEIEIKRRALFRKERVIPLDRHRLLEEPSVAGSAVDDRVDELQRIVPSDDREPWCRRSSLQPCPVALGADAARQVRSKLRGGAIERRLGRLRGGIERFPHRVECSGHQRPTPPPPECMRRQRRRDRCLGSHPGEDQLEIDDVQRKQGRGRHAEDTPPVMAHPIADGAGQVSVVVAADPVGALGEVGGVELIQRGVERDLPAEGLGVTPHAAVNDAESFPFGDGLGVTDRHLDDGEGDVVRAGEDLLGAVIDPAQGEEDEDNDGAGGDRQSATRHQDPRTGTPRGTSAWEHWFPVMRRPSTAHHGDTEGTEVSLHCWGFCGFKRS